MNHMQSLAAENRRNSEAEAAHIRRTLWGATDQPSVTESDDMGNTILGDIQYPAPIVVSQPAAQSSPLTTAALLLAMMLPTGAAAGAIGYLLARPQQTTNQTSPQSYQDETISLGLGRIEDFSTLQP